MRVASRDDGHHFVSPTTAATVDALVDADRDAGTSDRRARRRHRARSRVDVDAMPRALAIRHVRRSRGRCRSRRRRRHDRSRRDAAYRLDAAHELVLAFDPQRNGSRARRRRARRARAVGLDRRNRSTSRRSPYVAAARCKRTGVADGNGPRTTIVRIDVDATGIVRTVTIVVPSGDAAFDAALAARFGDDRYTPATLGEPARSRAASFASPALIATGRRLRARRAARARAHRPAPSLRAHPARRAHRRSARARARRRSACARASPDCCTISPGSIPAERLLRECDERGMPIDAFERANPIVLHARARRRARARLVRRDRRGHSLGNPQAHGSGCNDEPARRDRLPCRRARTRPRLTPAGPKCWRWPSTTSPPRWRAHLTETLAYQQARGLTAAPQTLAALDHYAPTPLREKRSA